MPGSTPATSQLDWLSSTTAMIVLSWSKATRDLLKSFSWGIGALRQLFASDDGAISFAACPIPSLRWREMDSNHRSPARKSRFLLRKANCGTERGQPKRVVSYAVPMVRIHLPPGASQVRTCLSREFVFLRREAAVFRGCAGRGERRGRQRRAGRGNIGATGGNISVGPYSSTAPPVDVGGLMIPVVFEFGSGSENRARRFEPAILSRMRSPADRSARRRTR